MDAGRAAGLVSAYRSQNGLGAVRVDARLMQAASVQARAMGESDRIGHGVAGSLPRRVSAAGYDWGATAENLSAGYPDLGSAMEAWKASASHRRNLLNFQVTDMGIAAVRTSAGSRQPNYWAMILAGPRPEAVAAGPFAMGAVQ